MVLYITNFGSYISKDGDCFLIKCGEDKTKISALKVSGIVINTSASLSTDAIQLALYHNIDIVFADKFGDPYGRVWHAKFGSTNLIRRKQLELFQSGEGINYAKEWLIEKSSNQAEFLNELAGRRSEDTANFLKEKSDYILNQSQKLKEYNPINDIENARGHIMGIEGSMGRVYFQSLAKIMPEKYRFEKRSFRPAKDEFNCLLNYSYGMLYSKVEKACIIAGIDPYCGFLHTDNYNKMSLVFDLIERYRIWAEKQAIFFFTGKFARDSFFEKFQNGIVLNKEGKKTFVPRMEEYFSEKINYKNRRMERINIIQADCHSIAKGWVEK